MRRLYAGFDGGGTKTTCVLCDGDGQVLGAGSGGPSNYHNEGVEGALASIKGSLRGALSQAGEGASTVSIEACLGLAGLDSPRDLSVMRRAVASARIASRCVVENDWRTAVTGAFVDEPGVVLIAGTGCVAAAQSAGGGRVVRVGGWGSVVDDRGSAYDIGREALYWAMRDYDGRGPSTSLLPMLMRSLRVREPQGIIARVYAGRMTVPEIASLSALVSEAAGGGDRVALRVLEDKGSVLGELVVSAASQLGMLEARFGVSPHGGVFNAGPPILRPLLGAVRRSAPLARLVEARLPPACGAVLLLMRRAGVGLDQRLVSAMRSSLARTAAPSRSGAGPGPSRSRRAS
ncbi:MAG: hypothetical protein JRM86_00425 [Nitrososphaerota archaeon]|nr:hypothetical protein [Nitrososphaerota archaeon]MDG6978232.1 hypothetical protein [Nitrososphaerota archaeon]MDG7005383.1 hypothetical protein [Nitrososphaerota archaeon]MDG7021191.1 hypothetical protein [Nitrososphaerota archaeon]MDG7021862.1 hypothetical protein [Nitrososphaerota archaeon]